MAGAASVPASLAEALAAFQKALPRVEKDNIGVIPGKDGRTGYCLDPATRVLTHDLTWTEVGKLSVGDRLAAFDEYPQQGVGCRRWRSAEVEETKLVTLPAYRVHLSNGASVVASSTHRWLVINKAGHMTWADTEKLRSRASHSDGCWHPHEIVSPVDTWDDDASREGGYLAGAFDGEGSLTMTPIERGAREHTYQLHLTFAQRRNAMLNRVEAVLAHLGFETQRTDGGGTNRDVDHLRVAGGRAEVLRFLGQVRPSRLLARFSADKLGTFRTHRRVAVERIEFLGERSVVAMQTSTRTLIAEGLASHNSYEYANLADISATVLPLLGAVGLSWSTKPTVNEHGVFVLEYRLRHSAGEEDVGAYPLPDPSRTPAQQVGSAITYARRYALCSVTGTAPGGDDDDGAGAQQATAQARERAQPEPDVPQQRTPRPADSGPVVDTGTANQTLANQGAERLLDTNTAQSAENVAAKIPALGVGDVSVSAILTQDDRAVLDETGNVTLDDLAALVLGYWARHGHGPRQEPTDGQAAPDRAGDEVAAVGA